MMPCVGFGTFQLKGDTVYNPCMAALAAGYIHIDTAAVYHNEEFIGKAIRDSGVPREKLFITSKLSPSEHGYESTIAACKASLGKLGTTYLDLYLIHWPGKMGVKANSTENAKVRRSSWKAMEKLYADGLCKAIGVSNYTVQHLRQLLSYASILPAINQIELHPCLQQREIRAFCKAHNIQVEAYSSLGMGNIVPNFPEITEIAKKYNKSGSQVLLRWGLQNDLVIIPKSATPARIKENTEIFDFVLNTDDITFINSLELNKYVLHVNLK